MLTRWYPHNDWDRSGGTDLRRALSSVNDFRREFDRLFGDVDPGFDRTSSVEFPQVELRDEGPAYVLRAELPGLTDKDIRITLQDGTLTLAGERAVAVPEGYSVHRQERQATKFSRSFTLPTKVDAEKTGATVKDGVLTVTLGKATEVQPRQITVKAAK